MNSGYLRRTENDWYFISEQNVAAFDTANKNAGKVTVKINGKEITDKAGNIIKMLKEYKLRKPPENYHMVLLDDSR